MYIAAYQPLARPQLPVIKEKQIHNPIDAFIQARLEKAGLRPVPEADRRTLIRRVFIDLTGRKFAPRAVTRNLVRRLAREIFRVRRTELEGWDMLLRMHSRFDRKAMPSGSSRPLRAMCHDEIVTLIDNAIRTIRRRSGSPDADARSAEPRR